MSNNGKSKAGQTILSLVFLIWFFGSIGAMIYFAKTGKTALALSGFGQYFLVFGLLGIGSAVSGGGFKLKYLPLLLFPLVGIGAIAGGIIIQYGSEEFKDKCLAAVPMIFIILFIVIGICLIIGGLYTALYLKRVCSEYVSAECIEVKKQYNKNRCEVYCPVYSFNYNGQDYKVCNDVYTNRFFNTVGINYELYINPNNPTQFYEPQKSTGTGLFMIIFGVVIVCFMGFVLFVMNK